jgi:hypothetical protein
VNYTAVLARKNITLLRLNLKKLNFTDFIILVVSLIYNSPSCIAEVKTDRAVPPLPYISFWHSA